jgi:F0F1-type ATP synthase assembly protein I
MFGNSKNTDDVKSTVTSTTSGLNALAKGTSLEGTLRCDSDLRIDGSIKGKLLCKAKLIIGPTGSVEGAAIFQPINCWFKAVRVSMFPVKWKLVPALRLTEFPKRRKSNPQTMQIKSPEEKKRSAIRALAEYSGMGFQLLAACLLGVFLGRWLDEKMQLERPLWAVTLTVLFMVASLVSIFRKLMRDS